MGAERLNKQVRTLRKGLKRLSGDSAPEEVHKLRTGAREIESLAGALPGESKRTRRLIKAIKPVRKAAGDVRDLDVLIADAMSLAKGPERESVLKLVEWLGTTRERQMGGLKEVVNEQGVKGRRRLKDYARRLKKKLPTEDDGTGMELGASLRTTIDGLTDELRRWPTLRARTAHRFRIKVKALRSLLRLERRPDARFIRALSEAKDQIGEWHDWHTLRETAGKILDAKRDRVLLVRIDREAERRLTLALKAGNNLQRKWLKPAAGKKMA